MEKNIFTHSVCGLLGASLKSRAVLTQVWIFLFLKDSAPFFFPDEDKNEERKQPGKNNLKLMTQVTKTHESEPHL